MAARRTGRRQDELDREAGLRGSTPPAGVERTVETVLSLQRSAGNAAVSRLLARSPAGEAKGASDQPSVDASNAMAPEQGPAESGHPVAGAEDAEALAGDVGPGKPPMVTAQGADAVKALSVLATAKPVTVSGGAMGDVELRPGDHVDGKMILLPQTTSVYYLDGTSVYQQWTPDFVRGVWLNAIATGAKGAEWIVPWLKAEMTLIQHMVMPLLATGVTVAQGLFFVYDRWPDVKAATAAGIKLLGYRAEFKKRYPTLYEQVFWGSLKHAAVAAWDGLHPADFASLIGRLIGKGGNLGKEVMRMKVVPLGLKAMLATFAPPVLTGAAAGIPRGGKAAAAETAKQLVSELSKAGITVTEEEARTMLNELRADKDADRYLAEVATAADDMAKAFEALETAVAKQK